LILRALLSGNVRLFRRRCRTFSGMPVERASGLVHASRSGGFEALYRQGRLPLRALPAFRAALDAAARGGVGDSPPAMRGCRGA